MITFLKRKFLPLLFPQTLQQPAITTRSRIQTSRQETTELSGQIHISLVLYFHLSCWSLAGERERESPSVCVDRERLICSHMCSMILLVVRSRPEIWGDLPWIYLIPLLRALLSTSTQMARDHLERLCSDFIFRSDNREKIRVFFLIFNQTTLEFDGNYFA